MDPQTALTTNIVLVALSGVLAGCFLAWALLPSRSERRALRWSENADLPLQESPIADRIVARLRQDAITAATGAADSRRGPPNEKLRVWVESRV